jgi:hypothetical protein
VIRRNAELDDPVVQLKGLVLVRDLLRDRGTDVEALEAEIVRARERLACKVELELAA